VAFCGILDSFSHMPDLALKRDSDGFLKVRENESL
jgi:hypothetical protein